MFPFKITQYCLHKKHVFNPKSQTDLFKIVITKVKQKDDTEYTRIRLTMVEILRIYEFFIMLKFHYVLHTTLYL